MIRLSKASISEQEMAAVNAVLKNEYLGLGPEVQAFEKELNAYFGGSTEAVCTATGTAALQLALQAVGVGVGDEVLVPTLTYVASFQAISALGAIPVACDVQASDALIDLNDAERRITKKCKAMMPVHYASNAGDWDAVYAFAKKHQLRVIEDAAHAFGTRYKNQLIGSQGDIVCFSFDGIKNVTCGEGGAVVSRDQAVIQYVKDARLLGVMKDSEKRYAKTRSWDFDVVDQGWRYHMSDILASIGRVQLQRFVSDFQHKRKLAADTYRHLLSEIPGVQLLQADIHNDIVPHIMPIRILNGRRDAVREHCLAQNIQIGMHYKPNHLLTKYGSGHVRLPVAEQLYLELMTLPMHTDLTPQNIEFIAQQIDLVMRKTS